MLPSPSCQLAWWRIYLSAPHVHHIAALLGPLCRQQTWHYSGTKPCRSPWQLHPAGAMGGKNKLGCWSRLSKTFLVPLVLVWLWSIFLLSQYLKQRDVHDSSGLQSHKTEDCENQVLLETHKANALRSGMLNQQYHWVPTMVSLFPSIPGLNKFNWSDKFWSLAIHSTDIFGVPDWERHLAQGWEEDKEQNMVPTPD